MAIRRNATSVWEGSGKDGTGHLTTKSTALNNVQYSYKSRFEEGVGTNPEELIAAAHSGCFNMKLSFVLGEAGFTPTKLETKCTVSLDSGTVTESHLDLTATVPGGITEEKFQECVANAKQNCPISKLLNCEIKVDAKLA